MSNSNHNLLPSDRAAIVGMLSPLSQSAGARSTGWVSMADWITLMAVLQVGALGSSGTVDAKLEQAVNSSGGSAKDIAGKAITQLTQAGTDDNKQAIINVRQTDLDYENGFTHLRLTVTTATAASLTSALVLGMDRRHGVPSAYDLASVDEIVA
jgi:hypothetical protein